jgi:hypothetical protein
MRNPTFLKNLRRIISENLTTFTDPVQTPDWPVPHGKAPIMNNDDRYNHNQVTEGEAVMRQVLQELAATGITGVLDATVAADDPRHYLCAANFRALIVMRRNGGWVADVLLRKSLPDGGPDIVGTPDASPFPTRRAALRAGHDLVQHYMLLAQAFFVGNRAFVSTCVNGQPRLYSLEI